MGETLDYERGKLCVGRMVRVIGNRSRKHGIGAMLKEAGTFYATVRPFGHKKDERVEWKFIQDWPSMNKGPAPLPPKLPKEPPPRPMPVIRRVPEMTALEHKELKAMALTPVSIPASVLALRSAVSDADATLDLGDLGSKIKAATADLEAARSMMKDAQAEVTARENRLRELRVLAKRALDQIDGAIGGTP